MNRIEEKLTNSKSLYEAYYKCYIEILLENNILLTKANVCLGADKVEFNNLGIVITDEQHRFGVRQRSKLSKCNSR